MKINPLGAESLNKGSLQYSKHLMDKTLENDSKQEKVSKAPENPNDIQKKGFKVDTTA